MYYEKLTALGIKCNNSKSSQKVFCPQCHDGRKNKHDRSLSVNVMTGQFNCHNCEFKGNVRSVDREKEKKLYNKPSKEYLQEIAVKERTIEYFNKRGISKVTMDKFMIFSRDEWMPQTQQKENCICFPYMRNGDLVNIKFRDARKNFKMVSNAELILYNIGNLSDKKIVIIHEGEIDCMSAYEAGIGREMVDKSTGEVITKTANIIPLSVPNGASTGSMKLDYLESCFNELLDVQEFIIATDNDEAGKKLKDELIRRLGVEKCRVISYPKDEVVPLQNGAKRVVKDMNEVLIYLGAERVRDIILNAQYIPVEGVYSVSDVFESMLENFRKGVQLSPTTHINVMDEFFRWKKGDITLITGYSNYGKTYFALQIMLIKSIFTGWKWGIYSPENYPANDFYDDLIEMYVGKWISNMSEAEYVNACAFIDDHFYYVHPVEDQSIDVIHEKFRYLILKKGIDGVVIDPYNQLDHNQKAFQREDQYLSEILKKVKRFALLNYVVYVIIAHPKNPTPNQDKSLPVPDQYSLNGGAMFGNKVDQLLVYHRPNHHIDKSSKEVDIYSQKTKRKRTGGDTGMFSLILNWSKKRFSNIITGDIFCEPNISDYVLKNYPPSRVLEVGNNLNYKPLGNNEGVLDYLESIDGEVPF